ncbi:MAG: hypothetical protein EOO16_17755 [Chitinophagaceae bacterium]|nr:MAG: hypothetical protein EOO16_17755 [Chitinophagaceae bacterium]
MKPLLQFFGTLLAMIAGVCSTVLLVIVMRIVLPASFFEFTMGNDPSGIFDTARLFASGFFFIGISGAVTALLSMARWPGPVLGLGWIIAAAWSGNSSVESWLEGALLAVCLFAPMLAHALVLQVRFRRRLAKASMELELGDMGEE